MKSIETPITEITGKDGTLRTDRFQRAILQVGNTPDRETNLSPAICVFGLAIKDFIPIHPEKYQHHHNWRDVLQLRENAPRTRHTRFSERLSEHSRLLPPLVAGDEVSMQNQTGPHPTKWDRNGIVIEVRQFDQYTL